MKDFGDFSGGKHIRRFWVYYEDTDAAGIVYYANYLKFAERARTDALRKLGVAQGEMLASQGVGFVVKRCAIDFFDSARLDDEISVETRLLEIRKVRMSMEQIIRRDEKELAKLVVDIAMIDRERRPTRIPEAIVQALQTHMTVKD